MLGAYDPPFILLREGAMKILALLLMGVFAVTFATSSADARRMKDSSDSGYCKSGVHVAHVKACKENGGKK
jgi:hypothetical protein